MNKISTEIPGSQLKGKNCEILADEENNWEGPTFLDTGDFDNEEKEKNSEKKEENRNREGEKENSSQKRIEEKIMGGKKR